MYFISPENEYPRHIGDIQLVEPSYKYGDALPDGWVEVADATPPTEGTDEVVYEDFPIEVKGVMTRNWKTRPMTAEEIERRDAPQTAKTKLLALGLTEMEIEALVRGLVA